MKKLLTIILVLSFLLPTIALSDLPDVTSFTDQELKDLISACSQELMNRNKTEPEGILLFEYEGVRVYQTGDAEIDRSGYLSVPVVVYNETEHEMVISAESTTCNGWDIYADTCRATGNAKNKDDLKFKVSDADVTSIDQITSLTFAWQVYDFTSYEVVYKQSERNEHRFW